MLSLLLRQHTKKMSNALDNVRSLLGNKAKDFITAVDEKNMIVVKELEEQDGLCGTGEDGCRMSMKC